MMDGAGSSGMLLVGEGEGAAMLLSRRPGEPLGVVLARAAEPPDLAEPLGSRWVWADAVRPDPLHALFAQSTNCCELGWAARRGRLVTVSRDVQRGELLMQVPAAAVVYTASLSSDGSDVAHVCAQEGESHMLDIERLGIDTTVIALTLELLQGEIHKTQVDHLAFSLLSHTESVSGEDFDRCLQLASNIRRFLMQRQCWGSSRIGGVTAESDEGVARLLLAVKSNAHAVLDDETANRIVGLGVYPAACLMNHSCSPTAALSFSSHGTLLHVRALCDLKRGQELTYSYLDEAQLFAPWEQRRELIRAAHHFEPSQPRNREISEDAALCRCLMPTEQLSHLTERVHELTRTVSAAAAAAQRAADAAGAPAAAAARAAMPARSGVAPDDAPVDAELTARMTSLRISVGSLRSLLEGQMRKEVHSAHWLVHDCLAALMQAARALDDPGLLAYTSLQLINAREEVLPLGTPGLAALYASHGSAMMRLLKAGRVPQAAESEALRQAEQALAAACRIRKCCLGDEHPLVRLTVKAHAEALRRKREYNKVRKHHQG